MRKPNLVQDATNSGGGGWSPEQRELLERVRAFTPAERGGALAATRARFTREDLAESKRRQRESAKLIDRLAATETLEEQQQLAGELCPTFDQWIRGRNRIQSTPKRRARPVMAARAPRRSNRSSGRPRAQATRSSARSGDSGDDASDPDPPAVEPWKRRWASDTAWLSLVRSVEARDLTLEIARERDRGEQWLPGYGGVETAAAPVSAALPQDEWIAGTF